MEIFPSIYCSHLLTGPPSCQLKGPPNLLDPMIEVVPSAHQPHGRTLRMWLVAVRDEGQTSRRRRAVSNRELFGARECPAVIVEW